MELQQNTCHKHHSFQSVDVREVNPKALLTQTSCIQIVLIANTNTQTPEI